MTESMTAAGVVRAARLIDSLKRIDMILSAPSGASYFIGAVSIECQRMQIPIFVHEQEEHEEVRLMLRDAARVALMRVKSEIETELAKLGVDLRPPEKP